MAYITNVRVKKFDSDKWVVNTPHGRNILVNDQTAELLSLLKKADSEEDVLIAFNNQFHQNISVSDLEKLLNDKFGSLNILAIDKTPEKARQSYLSIKVELLNAKVAEFLAEPFKYLYHPKLFWPVLTLAILFNAFLFTSYLDLKVNTLAGVSALQVLMMLYFSMLIHEIGHVAACKKIGVQNGGIGFGFYIIFPVVYADITNIWFASKSQRIIANLGGIYLEILYAGAIGFVSVYTTNPSLLVISFGLCIKVLAELNPFIRHDGYWILSDLTSTPNLLPRANYILKEFIRTRLFKRSRTILDEYTTKMWLLLVYGFVNTGFILVYLSLMLTTYFKEILCFPQNVYGIIEKIWSQQISWDDLKAEYLLVFGFYIIVLRLMISLIIKIRKRNSAITG